MTDGRYESWKWGYYQSYEYVGDPHTPCHPRSAKVIVIRLVWTTPCDPRSAKVIVIRLVCTTLCDPRSEKVIAIWDAIRDAIAIKNAITEKINDQVCNHDQASVEDTICTKKATAIGPVYHVCAT